MEALKGVRILDMTHVQAGPTCSQLLAWMGADVIKFEPPQGDATRGQLRDVPNADSLYFTMLNCNKRSITVNMKSAEGKQVFVDLLKKCDIMMENFGPGVLDRFGFTVGEDPRAQPEDRDGLDQGLRLERPLRGLQGLRERRAGDGRRDEHHRRARTVRRSSPARRSAIPAPACISPSACSRRCNQANRTGQGQYVEVAMMDGVMNLCRVKFRDHQRLTRGDLSEYSVPTYQGMGDVPRAGNDSGGGPARQRDPLQAARRERLALHRRAGSGVGRAREAHRPRRRHARSRDRSALRQDRRPAQEPAAHVDAHHQVRREATPSASSWRS